MARFAMRHNLRAALLVAALLGVACERSSLSTSAATATTTEPAQSGTNTLERTLIERADRWRCEPSVQWTCTLQHGCLKSESRPTVWVRLDFTEMTYGRCDANGCDSYPLTIMTGGAFTVAAPADRRGVFLKAWNDGSEFSEVTSAGTATLTAFGRCLPLAQGW